MISYKAVRRCAWNYALTDVLLWETERHPITNAIDGTNAWWQSPSIKNGNQFHWVTITLDLRQVRHGAIYTYELQQMV